METPNTIMLWKPMAQEQKTKTMTFPLQVVSGLGNFPSRNSIKTNDYSLRAGGT